MNATQATVSQNAPLVMQSALHRDSQVGLSDSTSELVASLKRFARNGTCVEKAGNTVSAQVRIDIVVSSPSARIGIICDQSDARKIHRQPSMLNELFLERVYLTSKLDTMMDPLAVAGGIARCEPDLFTSAGKSREGSMSRARIAAIPGFPTEPNKRGSRAVRQLKRDWSSGAGRSGRAA